MGLSTNSHKDTKGNTDQELGFRPVKPIHKEDSETSMLEDHHHNRMIITLDILSVQELCDQDHQEEEKNQFNNIIAPVPVSMPSTPQSSPHHLKLKKLEIPSYEVMETNDNDDDLNDGFKTPTSLDHKIPPLLECPGAPMKRRLMYDQLDSMFSISFMEDLDSVRNKKLKKGMF